jgi:hypothetical protein
MAGSWKKTWQVRSYPDAVRRIIKAVPRLYEDGSRDGIIGWVGRTYSHQRRDVKPKVPKLTVEKENRLVFQHDLLTPFTYTIELTDGGDGTTTIKVEVRSSATAKDTTAADQVVALCYALTKALEPFEE